MRVLIVGGGSVGLSAALFLAHHGVPVVLVEASGGPSIHPRATGLGPRTMEFFRECGIGDAVNAAALDLGTASLGKITAVTLAAATFPAPAPAAGPAVAAGPARAPEPPVLNPYAAVSPATVRGLCPQHRLDPVLLHAARQRGAEVRYGSTLVSLAQDEHGVTATLEDGQQLPADYVIAADGVRSGLRDALGIATSGPGALGRPKMNILFRADLRPYTAGRSFVGCDITTPEAPGLLMTVDGTDEWIFHVEYEPGETFDDERCRAVVRAAVGDPALDVEVRSALPWRVRAQLADRFRAGRVFLVGDAARAVPPIGAFGMNTGIADAHNLAWKLAAVHVGAAAPSLLDSYEAERRPVAEFVLDQAMRRLRDPRLHWATGVEADAARAAAGVVAAPIVHLGYRYAAGAVVDPEPELPSTRDVAAVLDGAPGSRVPHVWTTGDGRRVSTVDLVAGRWTLFTTGPRWPVPASVQVYRLDSCPGLEPGGALLVRPDAVVAWRSRARPADPYTEVAQALTTITGRAPEGRSASEAGGIR